MTTVIDSTPKVDQTEGLTGLRVFVAEVDDDILRVCITTGEPAPRASTFVLGEYPAQPMRDVTEGALKDVGAFRVGRRAGLDYGPLLELSLRSGTAPLARVTKADLTPVDLVRFDTGGEPPQVESVRTVDGQRSIIRNLVPHSDGQAFLALLGLAVGEDEGLYGLGFEEDGAYNRRGSKVHLYQHNMRIPMPCLVSDRGYGVLVDCASLMTFEEVAGEARLSLEAVPAIDFYLVAGEADQVVRGFRRLTGHAPLLPKWAFGYVQSKERYSTSAELVEVARTYRDLGVPLDCVVQDWKSWTGDEWGQKTVDKERFPDLEEMRTALHNLNVHSMVSVWPNMAAGCDDHAEFAEAGLLLGDFSTYDAFDARGRDLYSEQLRRELAGAFDSWWCDSTEPFTAPDWQGSIRLSEDERFALVGQEHARYLGARRANLYALEHARGIFEHEIAAQKAGTALERRVLNLTRSGYPGIQRYGAVLWSGDVSATWNDLRAEVTKVISMSLCGIPWWTTDAGGFFVGGTASWRNWSGDPDAAPVWFWNGDYDAGVANLGFRELYTRWLQFSCLIPMFRSHGTDTPRELWNFGAPGEPIYDAIESTIRLRYRLLPYIYTVAARASLADAVMVRGLLFDFVEDKIARDVSDQFLLGTDLMICPVIEPSYFGSDGEPLLPDGITVGATRNCYLPTGTSWWDFWTDESFEGGQWVEAEAPIGRTPLFVRAGSVIPLQGPVDHALANRDVFDVVVYPGADGAGQLYDDDGVTHDYARGGYSLVDFTWQDEAQTLGVQASSWVRENPMTLHIFLSGRVESIVFDGTPTSINFKEKP